MYGLLCKRLLLLRPSTIRASKTLLGFLQFDDTSVHFIRFCSSSFNERSSEVEKQQQSFAVSYLINSWGLSLESALSTSEKVNLQTPDKADSVLSLLRNHGFSKTHISKVVRTYPRLLFANPEKTLLPKLHFFYSIGVSSTDLPEIFSKNPSILTYSLEKYLIPTYNFLKSAVPDERVIVTFTRCLNLRRFPRGAEKIIAPKVASLRDLGVPESVISHFITCYPSAVTGGSENFDESLKKVIKMGFNPSKTTFILAVQVICQMTKSTWEHKMKVYRRWGWSEDEVWMAFKVHPQCMRLSENKIVSTMDCLVNKMGWQPAAIAKNPTVLFFNLEKRIIPRCLVIKVLVLKGLIKKDRSLGGFLNIPEKHFLDKFVAKYLEEVPQLLNVYEGKMGLLDLGFGSAEICGMKQLWHSN